MEQGTLQTILEYVWIPVVTGLGFIWTKLTGISTRTALLEQAEAHYKEQRIEDHKLRDQQRQEIVQKIEGHHKVIMHKLESVEARVKNGH